MNSDSIWKKLVLDAKSRGCFYNASEEKNLAQATMDAMIEIGQLDTLFNTDSLPFRNAKWKVDILFCLFANKAVAQTTCTPPFHSRSPTLCF